MSNIDPAVAAAAIAGIVAVLLKLIDKFWADAQPKTEPAVATTDGAPTPVDDKPAGDERVGSKAARPRTHRALVALIQITSSSALALLLFGVARATLQGPGTVELVQAQLRVDLPRLEALAQEAMADARGAELAAAEAQSQVGRVSSDYSEIASTVLLGAVPSGTIVAWFPLHERSEAPEGWHICDGTGNTPDLRNRFLMGVGSFGAVGEEGGEKDILEGGEHNHKRNAKGDGNDEHTTGLRVGHGDSKSPKVILGVLPSGEHNHGGENRPPFYTVLYIMKMP